VKQTAYCLFETPLGTCGIGWLETGAPRKTLAVACLQLPETTPKATKERIARKSSGSRADAPPPAIAEVIEKICQHLRGELQDFRDVPLHLGEVGAFDRQVYEAALRIPPGETSTYGELARAVGRPTEARAVGQAMARNPIPIIIPCHRVLAANGRLGGFSAHGERLTKAKLLSIERAKFPALLDFPI
jgi:O-6-methylguanine DNA methyltransferase